MPVLVAPAGEAVTGTSGGGASGIGRTAGAGARPKAVTFKLPTGGAEVGPAGLTCTALDVAAIGATTGVALRAPRGTGASAASTRNTLPNRMNCPG